MTLLFQRRCPSLVSLILFLTVMATVSTAQARAFTLTGEGSLLPGSAVWNPSTSPAIPGPGIDNATLMPGWPITLPVSGSSLNFGPSRGLVLADIDLDGKQDVIASSTNSLVYAWDLTGTPLPGWPVTVTLMPQYAPSVADLDGDGTLEVIQATRGATSGGMIYVFNHDGTAMTGWPKAVGTKGNYATASMTCVDLDGDGTLEIIAGERDYPIGHLWVFNHDGTSFPGKWPVALDHVPTASATVAK